MDDIKMIEEILGVPRESTELNKHWSVYPLTHDKICYKLSKSLIYIYECENLLLMEIIIIFFVILLRC